MTAQEFISHWIAAGFITALFAHFVFWATFGPIFMLFRLLKEGAK